MQKKTLVRLRIHIRRVTEWIHLAPRAKLLKSIWSICNVPWMLGTVFTLISEKIHDMNLEKFWILGDLAWNDPCVLVHHRQTYRWVIIDSSGALWNRTDVMLNPGLLFNSSTPSPQQRKRARKSMKYHVLQGHTQKHSCLILQILLTEPLQLVSSPYFSPSHTPLNFITHYHNVPAHHYF